MVWVGGQDNRSKEGIKSMGGQKREKEKQHTQSDWDWEI